MRAGASTASGGYRSLSGEWTAKPHAPHDTTSVPSLITQGRAPPHPCSLRFRRQDHSHHLKMPLALVLVLGSGPIQAQSQGKTKNPASSWGFKSCRR